MEQYVFIKRLKGLKVKKNRFLESPQAQQSFPDEDYATISRFFDPSLDRHDRLTCQKVFKH